LETYEKRLAIQTENHPLEYAAFDGSELVSAGRVGTGFSSRQLTEMRAQIDAIARKDPPFAAGVPAGTGHGWVEPELVVEESLLFLANLASIPLHIWSSRVDHLQFPDWCIPDLDPTEVPFPEVIDVAKVISDLCEERTGFPAILD